MSRERLFVGIATLLLLAAVAAGARGHDPLTTADIVRFLRAGIGERTILAELRDRGFAEPLDAAREAALREAGASETLVVAVRRDAPAGAPSTPAPTSPPPRGDEAAMPVAKSPHGLTFGATTRSVRVPVSVLDKRGQPVLGLRSEDFEVSENGQRQAVTYFSGERRPLRIALALDVSASMADKMSEVAEALRHFIDILEPADEVLVITFSADLIVAQDFTSDRELLERVLTTLQPARGTALYDAAIEALHRVASGPAESKAIVLVTDGMDTASRASFEELREIARRTEVPIFSIGIGNDPGLRDFIRQIGGIAGGPGRGPGRGWPGGVGRPGRPGGPGGGGFPGGGGGWPPGGGGGGGGPRGIPGGTGPVEADFDARPLLDLADDTGGQAVILKGLHRDPGKAHRLKDAVESIAVTLRHRYLVGYEPEAGKPGWRKIRVEVDRSSVKVQARKGYYL